jgi:transcriptional regulator with XRE-family HTH domain
MVGLVGALKGSSGLSFRDLAERADVAVSTITRVKAGAVEPTVDTLTRLLDSAGYELQATRRPEVEPPAVRSLTSAWTERGGRLRPDWSRWRALLDRLALEPDRIAEAIYPAPPPSGSPVIDSLLAAVAEKLADDAGLRRPAWTTAVPELPEPWRPPARGRDSEVPEQLAARRLMVDGASLWRDPATVGT